MAVFPTGAVHRPTNNYVWDPGTMAWVVETQPGGSGGGAATIADGADVVEGSIGDAAIITDTTGTVNGKLRGLVKWAFERMPASLGQKAMAASLPVVIASDQSAIPVTGTFFQATQPVSLLGTAVTNTVVSISGGTPIVTVTLNGATTVAFYLTAMGGNAVVAEASPDNVNWEVVPFLVADSTTTGQFGTVPAVNQLSLVNVSAMAAFRLHVTIPLGTTTGVISAGFGNVLSRSEIVQGPSNGTNAQAWWTQIGDTVTGPVAVKAASTAAIATDKALVIAVSPNNTPVLPLGAATSANQTTEITSLASIDTKLTSPLTFIGNKANNAVVPGAINVGILPAVATALSPTYTEGFQVGLSTNLTGRLQVADAAQLAWMITYQQGVFETVLAELKVHSVYLEALARGHVSRDDADNLRNDFKTQLLN